MYLGMSLISLRKLDEAEKELQRAVTLAATRWAWLIITWVGSIGAGANTNERLMNWRLLEAGPSSP